MIHCQAPETMGKDQDFPISVEVQLLGGGPTGERSTANMCSPGTEVFRDGAMVKGHCMNSTSQTYRGDQWVRVEAEVLGSERVRHMIDGKVVLEYTNLQIGGGNVSQLRSGGEEGRHASRRGLHCAAGREPSYRIPQSGDPESLGLHGSEGVELQDVLRAPRRLEMYAYGTPRK